jgi:Tol biopolymer transport system component
VMVAQDGTVKVLDFGLAKLKERGEAPAGAPGAEAPGLHGDTAPTRSAPLTSEGTVVGTAAYMSPEQAEGRPVDARSDIFSFGAVLYEMATGRRAFTGDSWASTMSAVLSQEPKPLEGIPHDLERTILRCLRKDPDKRFQHMDDVCVALEELKEESDSGKLGVAALAPPRVPTRRRLVYSAAVMVLVLAAAAVAWRWRIPPAPELGAPRVVPLTTFPGYEYTPAFSPDGKQVAFSWNGPNEDNFDIYVMLIGTAAPVRLTTDRATERCPAWSPDGRRIAYVRVGPKVSVMLMSALGGSERELGETTRLSPGVDWSPDGKWVAFPASSTPGGASQIVLLSPDTGERKVVTSPPPGGSGDGSPRFSPDGRSIAFQRERYPGTWGLGVVGLADQAAAGRFVSPVAARVYRFPFAWTLDSRELLFSATYEGALWGLWRMAADGGSPPTRVVGTGQSPRDVAVSPQGGLLAFSENLDDANIWRLTLEDGRAAAPPVKLIASTRMDTSPAYSSDGRRIAFASSRSGGFEIWVCNADGSNQAQVTRLGAPVTGSPQWSPDGKTIAFDSDADGQTDIYTVSADGGPPRRLTDHPGMDVVPTWSRDGRWLYFMSDRSGTRQLWKVPAEGGAPVQITTQGGVNATESADGGTLYYNREEYAPGMVRRSIGTGDEELFLEVPEVARWWQVAVARNGVYYLGPDNAGTRPVRYAVFFYEFATAKTTRVAQLDKTPQFYSRGLAVSPDGRTLLISQLDASGSDLMLLENFR